jgi:hypothetical protein
MHEAVVIISNITGGIFGDHPEELQKLTVDKRQ